MNAHQRRVSNRQTHRNIKLCTNLIGKQYPIRNINDEVIRYETITSADIDKNGVVISLNEDKVPNLYITYKQALLLVR